MKCLVAEVSKRLQEHSLAASFVVPLADEWDLDAKVDELSVGASSEPSVCRVDECDGSLVEVSKAEWGRREGRPSGE